MLAESGRLTAKEAAAGFCVSVVFASALFWIGAIAAATLCALGGTLWLLGRAEVRNPGAETDGDDASESNGLTRDKRVFLLRSRAFRRRIKHAAAGCVSAGVVVALASAMLGTYNQMQAERAAAAQADRIEDDTSAIRADMNALRELIQRGHRRAGDDPTVPSTYTPEEQAIIDAALASDDARLRAEAAIASRDLEEAQRLIAEHREQAAEDAFRWALIEGDAAYFAGNFGAAIEPYERAHALRPNNVDVMFSLARSLLGPTAADSAEQLTRSIDLYTRLLAAQPREAGPLDWAHSQHNLGVAWHRLPTGDLAINNQNALDAYHNALMVYTRDEFPDDWALTQNNVGNAWAKRPVGDHTTNIRNAIDAYNNALTVYTSGTHPVEWAQTQFNLGLTWSEFQSGDRATSPQNAINAYNQALTILTRDGHPLDWAKIQNNLGVAWSDLPNGDRATNIQNAIDSYNNALTVRTRDAHPIKWALTQRYIGIAWSRLPAENRAINIQNAIDAYNNALTIYRRETHPIEWAGTQLDLGLAWAHLFTGDRTTNMRIAIDAFNNALMVYERDTHALEWADTQYALADAWASAPNESHASLSRAMDAYRRAHSFYTRDAHPLDWADLHVAQGLNLASRALLHDSADCADLGLAADHFVAAMTVFTASEFPDNHRYVSRALADIDEMIIEACD